MIRPAILAAALALLAGPARGHGDARWIMDDPQTAFCCGPQDCEPAPPGEVVEIGPDAWRFRGVDFHRGDRRTFPAQPHPTQGLVFWYCQPQGQPVRCLFFPPQAI